MIARPDPSFAGCVNDCDCSITVRLCLEDPIQIVERLLRNRSRHRNDKLWKEFLWRGRLAGSLLRQKLLQFLNSLSLARQCVTAPPLAYGNQ